MSLGAATAAAAAAACAGRAGAAVLFQLGTAFAGVGVGLAVVRRVAERHGGSVDAESGLDLGARFTLELPDRARSDAR